MDRCPICKSNMKIMYKPESQLHCRGRCGMIIRFSGEFNESKDMDTIIELLNNQH